MVIKLGKRQSTSDVRKKAILNFTKEESELTNLLPKEDEKVKIVIDKGSENSDVRQRLTPGARGTKTHEPNKTGAVPKNGYQPTGKGPAPDNEKPRYIPDDWDDSLPYGGKVYLARKKKPDGLLCILLQVFLGIGAVALVYYAWYHTEHMHYHVTRAYAHLGHSHAQATVGHKLLHGKGVDKNHTEAMEWFKKAADQGHPHASYNVAIGHMQGIQTGLQPGQARKFIAAAANQGVPEAVEVLEKICSRGHCDV